MVHTIAIANSVIHFSPFEIVLMILMPLVVAAFLVWYAKVNLVGKAHYWQKVA